MVDKKKIEINAAIYPSVMSFYLGEKRMQQKMELRYNRTLNRK